MPSLSDLQIEADMMTDLDALTLTLWGEARGEPLSGIIAVAMVVMNRLKQRYKGDNTAAKVCLHTSPTGTFQFSCWRDEADAMGRMLERIVGNPHNLPPDLAKCREVAQEALAGQLADNTRGANHYYEKSIPTPYWAKDLTPLVEIGKHRFFNVA